MRKPTYMYAGVFLLCTLTARSLQAVEPAMDWQRVAERATFDFKQREANILSALSQYGSDCEIHMIYDPKRGSGLDLRFVREGKEILALRGHTRSVFRTQNNVLYFAAFSPWANGCSVAAYDLRTGKKRWETQLKGIGGVGHSAYQNLINMGMASDAVSIVGHESFGDYLEILDVKTGRTVGHKVFRKVK